MQGLSNSVIFRLIDRRFCVNDVSGIRLIIVRVPILLLILLLLSCGEESTEPTNSSNKEINWEQTNFSGKNIFVVTADSSLGILASGERTGIFRSTNNGQTWIHVGLADSTISNIIIGSNKTIIASNNLGIFRSNDDGNSWIKTGHKTMLISCQFSYFQR